MKKIWNILLLWLCCISLAGCGKEEEDVLQGGVAEYTDVQADSETIFGEGIGHVVGVQFYQGEAVQIVSSRDGNGLADVCLYREDGSREVLLEGMPEDYYYGNRFLDAEGNFYRWGYDTGNSLMKMDPSGKALFTTSLNDIGAVNIEDICQLANGRVLITYLEGGGGDHYTLSEIDPATGKISKVGTVKLDGLGRVAAGGTGLLYIDQGGVYEIDMETGSRDCILPFTGTSYILQDTRDIEDFCVLGDGSIEILWYRQDGDTGNAAYYSEVVQTGTETTEKYVLTLRCHGLSQDKYGIRAWLKNQVAVFNQQDGSYMVVLDESPEGVEKEDFARQTSIEMTAGKGPDLVLGDVLGDYIYGAIRKGALVDLSPYMEASGIKEEDYFTAAFGCWQENGGVYGVAPGMWLSGYRFMEEVLGGNSVPDVGALVDALLAWEGDAVFKTNYGSQWILEYLLEGSEDFWGMLDWENGACDFSGELFAKILEVSKRYGYDERNNYPQIMQERSANLLTFDTAANREAEGMVDVGVLFDDGGHPAIAGLQKEMGIAMLAVNSNSAYVEGAWEFISFLLGEGAQSTLGSDHISLPVHRKAFEARLAELVAVWTKEESVAYGQYVWDNSGNPDSLYPRSYEELTEEKLAEYTEFVEDARPLPMRTVPLLDIICEEAEYYFNGTKSIEEVSAVIQNRVQLYMDENK